jgi:hypothetical protein
VKDADTMTDAHEDEVDVDGPWIASAMSGGGPVREETTDTTAADATNNPVRAYNTMVRRLGRRNPRGGRGSCGCRWCVNSRAAIAVHVIAPAQDQRDRPPGKRLRSIPTMMITTSVPPPPAATASNHPRPRCRTYRRTVSTPAATVSGVATGQGAPKALAAAASSTTRIGGHTLSQRAEAVRAV